MYGWPRMISYRVCTCVNVPFRVPGARSCSLTILTSSAHECRPDAGHRHCWWLPRGCGGGAQKNGLGRSTLCVLTGSLKTCAGDGLQRSLGGPAEGRFPNALVQSGKVTDGFGTDGIGRVLQGASWASLHTGIQRNLVD